MSRRKRASQMSEQKPPVPSAAAVKRPHDSAFAVEPGAEYDPHMDSIRYLLSRKWIPLGSLSHPNCLWWDPTRSTKETSTKVPVIALHVVGTDDKKNPVYENKPVMVKNKFNRPEPAMQTRVTMPGNRYTIHQAVELQVERDMAGMNLEEKLVGIKTA